MSLELSQCTYTTLCYLPSYESVHVLGGGYQVMKVPSGRCHLVMGVIKCPGQSLGVKSSRVLSGGLDRLTDTLRTQHQALTLSINQ